MCLGTAIGSSFDGTGLGITLGMLAGLCHRKLHKKRK